MFYSQALTHLLPALDDIYDRYQDTATTLTSELALKHTNVKITCRKGCAACCHFPIIPATAGETFVLLSRLIGAGQSLAEIQRRFASYAATYFRFATDQGSLPFTESQQKLFFTLKLPCPFLTTNTNDSSLFSGSCGVFSARPLICDYFQSTDDPQLCAQKKPHGSFQALFSRGEIAIEEVRAQERALFGRSALGHMPLLMAALCTEAGMNAFLDDSRVESPAQSAEDQAEMDFEFYIELLRAAGYEMTKSDILSLLAAQNALLPT